MGYILIPPPYIAPRDARKPVTSLCFSSAYVVCWWKNHVVNKTRMYPMNGATNRFSRWTCTRLTPYGQHSWISYSIVVNDEPSTWHSFIRHGSLVSLTTPAWPYRWLKNIQHAYLFWGYSLPVDRELSCHPVLNGTCLWETSITYTFPIEAGKVCFTGKKAIQGWNNNTPYFG